jgi:hypothetical protein
MIEAGNTRYEVLRVKERDGYCVLPFGQFTMTRFEPVSDGETNIGGSQ